MPFTLLNLPYSYAALEPYYDATTVEIHHARHHNTYVNKLNQAVELAGIEDQSLEEILKNLDSLDKEIRTVVRNHAGGVWNHNFFWESIKPNGGGTPTGAIAEAIEKRWGSFAEFKDAFSVKAATHFGSGWVWLVEDKGKLEITDTHDQICPLSLGQKALLTIDVWEHAYYLKYQNKRPDWIAAFWNLVNWDKVNERIG